ncbi:MAG: hypothetical protein AAF614_16825 [Chloroflexota bacterium]
MNQVINHFRYVAGVIIFLAISGCQAETTVLPTAIPATSTPTSAPALARQDTPVPTATVRTEPDPTTTPVPLPTETAVSTSTATPTPINISIPTFTPAPATTPLPAVVSGAPAEAYAIVGVEPEDTLNVRNGPGVDNDIVGEIPHTGMGIQLLGDIVMVGESAWSQVQFEETMGWVNTTFLAGQYGTINHATAERAAAMIYAIKTQNYAALSTYAHPQKGVRFSPYTYVREEHTVLTSAQISSLGSDATIYLWGYFDGLGTPIELSFADYYLGFIYDVDFFRPHNIGFNSFIGYSNTINNISEVYPDAVTVEYHFNGFEPRYEGMDWRGLRLILEEQDGVWYLVGVVHSEWTI